MVEMVTLMNKTTQEQEVAEEPEPVLEPEPEEPEHLRQLVVVAQEPPVEPEVQQQTIAPVAVAVVVPEEVRKIETAAQVE
jgi:hypothetical protein